MEAWNDIYPEYVWELISRWMMNDGGPTKYWQSLDNYWKNYTFVLILCLN